jgi:hypothetical protein
LQHFPVLILPRVGDKVSVAGVEGKFEVTEIEHAFQGGNQQRQDVFVTVKENRRAIRL